MTITYKNINMNIGATANAINNNNNRFAIQRNLGRTNNLKGLFTDPHDKKYLIIAYKDTKAVGFLLSSQGVTTGNHKKLGNKVTIVRLKGEPDIREGLIRRLIAKYNGGNKNISIETGPYTRATNNSLKMFQNLKFGIAKAEVSKNGSKKYIMNRGNSPVKAIGQLRHSRIVDDVNLRMGSPARKLEQSLIELLYFLNYHRKTNGFVLKPFIDTKKRHYKIKLVKTKNNNTNYNSPTFGNREKIKINRDVGGQGEEDVRNDCIQLMTDLRKGNVGFIIEPKKYNITHSNNKEIIVSPGEVTPIILKSPHYRIETRHIPAFVETCKRAIGAALKNSKT